ncbi:MAG: helix-turn-helix domain-containing protein [Rhodocyclaceae bacterium]|nr:helix-turn-helix domain-containing protein [Rhodocyclaceae bacterium]
MEREAFSRRLRQALAGAGCDDRSPTKLAHDFNRKFKGGDISVNTAHKWLRGETMPTQDKLRALAAWLGVTPEWLRFGEADAPAAAYSAREPVPTESDLELMRAFRRLNAGHRQAVREMLLALERAERQRL